MYWLNQIGIKCIGYNWLTYGFYFNVMIVQLLFRYMFIFARVCLHGKKKRGGGVIYVFSK